MSSNKDQAFFSYQGVFDDVDNTRNVSSIQNLRNRYINTNESNNLIKIQSELTILWIKLAKIVNENILQGSINSNIIKAAFCRRTQDANSFCLRFCVIGQSSNGSSEEKFEQDTGLRDLKNFFDRNGITSSFENSSLFVNISNSENIRKLDDLIKTPQNALAKRTIKINNDNNKESNSSRLFSNQPNYGATGPLMSSAPPQSAVQRIQCKDVCNVL